MVSVPYAFSKAVKDFHASTSLHITNIDQKLKIGGGAATIDFYCHTDTRAPSFFAKARFIKGKDGAPSNAIGLSLLTQMPRPDILIKKVRVLIDKRTMNNWKTINALVDHRCTGNHLLEIKMGYYIYTDGDVLRDYDVHLLHNVICYDYDVQRIHDSVCHNSGFSGLPSVKEGKTFTAVFEVVYQRFVLEKTPTKYSRPSIKDLSDLSDQEPKDVVFVFCKTSHQDQDHQDQGPVVEIPAHKDVLKQGSEYFAKMFDSNMKESKQDKIELKGVEPEVFRALLDYFYGTLSADCLKKYAVPLCILADKYCLTDFKEMCERNVMINLDHTTVVDALILTNILPCDPLLFKHAKALLRRHFFKISDLEKLFDYPLLMLTVLQPSDTSLQCEGKDLCKVPNRCDNKEHVEEDFS